MISLKERMVVSTVITSVAFIILGIFGITTGATIWPSLVGFALGSYGVQLIIHFGHDRHEHRHPHV